MYVALVGFTYYLDLLDVSGASSGGEASYLNNDGVTDIMALFLLFPAHYSSEV